MRPNFLNIFMDLAISLSVRSTCKRLHVGTVITSVDYRKVLAIGYNGNASGLPNQCDSDIPGSCGCLHSEENAVINCDCLRDTPKIVFITHSPCYMCAKRLINLGGVRSVFYNELYRDSDKALNILKQSGIHVDSMDLWR